MRGGSFNFGGQGCRSAWCHNGATPDHRFFDAGFRVIVRDQAAQKRLWQEGAENIQGRRYKIFWEPISWTAAKQRCEQMKGSLASVDSLKKQALLAGLKGHRVVWVGGYRNSKRRWQWLNGQEIAAHKLLGDDDPASNFAGFSVDRMEFSCRPDDGVRHEYAIKKIEGFICEWDADQGSVPFLSAAKKASSGPLLEYSFDQATISQVGTAKTVDDLSGHGNHGAIFEANWVPLGKIGGALRLDGKGKIAFEDSGFPIADAARSVSLWFRTSDKSNRSALVRYGDMNKEWNPFYVVLFENTEPTRGGKIAIGNPGGKNEVAVSRPVNDGKWHHVTLVYNGKGLALLYLDGNREVVCKRNYATTLTGQGILGEGFIGDLADVHVFDRALTDEEIKSLYDRFQSSAVDSVPKTIADKTTKSTTPIKEGARFTTLDIKRVATCASSRIFNEEVLNFPSWGKVSYHDVPFVVLSHDGGKTSNTICLYSGRGAISQRMPRVVRLPCNLTARRVHMLAGAGWGVPWTGKGSLSMIVKLEYGDGAKEDHRLINGVHLTDWARGPEVPGSKNIGVLQVRYLSLAPQRPESELRAIEFHKGPDATSPFVMAITVEM